MNNKMNNEMFYRVIKNVKNYKLLLIIIWDMLFFLWYIYSTDNSKNRCYSWRNFFNGIEKEIQKL